MTTLPLSLRSTCRPILKTALRLMHLWGVEKARLNDSSALVMAALETPNQFTSSVSRVLCILVDIGVSWIGVRLCGDAAVKAPAAVRSSTDETPG